VSGAVDFNTTSPNYAHGHNLFELEVTRIGVSGGCYYDGTAFWGATFPTVTGIPAPGYATKRGSITTQSEAPQLISATFFDLESDGTTTLHPFPNAVSGAPDDPRPATTVTITAAPNPFVYGTSIFLSLPTAQDVDVVVTDISGRLVWRMAKARMGAGSHRIPWYGHDLSGRQVPPGVYLVRVHAGGGVDLRKTIIRLR
jgi:hypothetical protein